MGICISNEGRKIPKGQSSVRLSRLPPPPPLFKDSFEHVEHVEEPECFKKSKKTKKKRKKRKDLIHPPIDLNDSLDNVYFDEGVKIEERTHTPIGTNEQAKKGKIPIQPKRCIRDTAMETCNTVLTGFRMALTECILRNIDHDIFHRTDNAEIMQRELDRNSSFWKNKSTPMAITLRDVYELLNAINTIDEKKKCEYIMKVYYRAQPRHTLNTIDVPIEIPVYIHRDKLESMWIPNIENAIKSIDNVTPGINLFETNEYNESKIRIGVNPAYGSQVACTNMASIFDPDEKPFIHLGKDWHVNGMKRTSIHELMHALSFFHEMQRSDADMYLQFGKNVGHNYKKRDDNALTRFDPFSVMMYSESADMKRKAGDSIWLLKAEGKSCDELSELDKVALNLKYKPCINKSKNYEPKLSKQNEMLYCGRKVMDTHTQVGKSTADGICGPNNWANCAACRVILQIGGEEIQKLKNCLRKGKWQGLSGIFYCGKDIEGLKAKLSNLESNGKCGPDTGVPCEDCGKELFSSYSIEHCVNIYKSRV